METTQHATKKPMRHDEIKEEINSNTVIVGDFITSLTLIDRLSRQKIKKETQALNDTIDQIN